MPVGVVGGVIEEGKARLAREIAQVSAWKMPDFVVEALRAFQETREGRSFAQWLDAAGEAKLVALAETFAAVPDWSENQAPYIDWSATEPFSPARGGAECSAGLFDLIEVDRKAIERAREVLDESPEDVRALYATLLSTARMLLIARSLEPVGDRAVFEAFATEFVKTGLVPARFSSLLLRARELGVVGASGRSAEVLELASIVEALYQGMDDSLRFPELPAAV